MRDVRAALGAGVPILYPGDIFHRWNSSAELINFALANLPRGWAVAGNHDLPNHAYGEVERSAYWTLVEAGVLDNIPPDGSASLEVGDQEVTVCGFPYGASVHGLGDDRDPEAGWHVALIHAYIWSKPADAHERAKPEQKHQRWYRRLIGYDFACFGDNHRPFVVPGGEIGEDAQQVPCIVNNGCLIRRRRDETDIEPAVAILWDDGTAARFPLDVSADLWADAEDLPDLSGFGVDAEDLIDALREAGMTAINFGDAIRAAIDGGKLSDGVRSLLVQWLDRNNDRGA